MNILSAEQQEISDRFAFKGPKDFSDLETTTAETGAPILKDAIGWVDCKLKEISAGWRSRHLYWRDRCRGSSRRVAAFIFQRQMCEAAHVVMAIRDEK
ncbi:MAG: flavin reductase [Planctomycetaceae bacterium]|nr:flavin reductase [Planctomycetaceae bacterium]